MSLAGDRTGQQAELIELLVRTDTVRAWRVGTDIDIECKEGYTDEDFDRVLDTLNLRGRTDYAVSYFPAAGLEIFRLPIVPRQRGLG